jgi:hypothetical protein
MSGENEHSDLGLVFLIFITAAEFLLFHQRSQALMILLGYLHHLPLLDSLRNL